MQDSLVTTAATGLSPTDVATISVAVGSFAVAALSLGIVVYLELLRGFKLRGSADQVSVLRAPESLKQQLLPQILVEDLMSQQPTEYADSLIQESPKIAAAAKSKNVLKLLDELRSYSKNHPIDMARIEDAAIERVVNKVGFTLNFFIPVFLFNSGKKPAHIRSIVFVVHLEGDPSKRWVFVPFVELDARKLLDRGAKHTDADRIKGLFPGIGLPPGEGLRLSPWLIPMGDTRGKPISTENMKPGRYTGIVFVYGADGKRILKINVGGFNLTMKDFADSFRGSESINYLRTEDDVSDAISGDEQELKKRWWQPWRKPKVLSSGKN